MKIHAIEVFSGRDGDFLVLDDFRLFVSENERDNAFDDIPYPLVDGSKMDEHDEYIVSYSKATYVTED